MSKLYTASATATGGRKGTRFTAVSDEARPATKVSLLTGCVPNSAFLLSLGISFLKRIM